MFVITRLSRAMRSLKHLIHLAEELRARDAGRRRGFALHWVLMKDFVGFFAQRG